jgi:hypothetical protein
MVVLLSIAHKGMLRELWRKTVGDNLDGEESVARTIFLN